MSKYDDALAVVLKKMSDKKTAIAGTTADLHSASLSLPDENTPVPELVSWGTSISKIIADTIAAVGAPDSLSKEFFGVVSKSLSFIKLCQDYDAYTIQVAKDQASWDKEQPNGVLRLEDTVSIVTMDMQSALITSCISFAVEMASYASKLFPASVPFFEGLSLLMSGYSIVQNQIHANNKQDYLTTINDVDQNLKFAGVSASAASLFASYQTKKYATEEAYLVLQPIANFILRNTTNAFNQDDLDRARDLYKIFNAQTNSNSMGEEGLQFISIILKIYEIPFNNIPEETNISNYINLITNGISELIRKDIQNDDIKLQRLFEIENIANVAKDGDGCYQDSAYAYRYALTQGNIFAVISNNTKDLYDKYNIDGALELYDPATGKGQLTEIYLQKRAEYIQKLIAANLAEKDYVEADIKDFSGEMRVQQKFYDETTKSWINHIADVPSNNRVTAEENVYFGTDDEEHGDILGPDSWTGKSTSNDYIFGGKGNDVLIGWLGNDYLEGGSGDDYLYGELKNRPWKNEELSLIVTDNDTLNGGSGNDHLYGGRGNDILIGGLDNDHLYGDRVADPGILEKKDHADGEYADTLYGELGNDFLYGDGGDDVLYGDGREVLYPNANINKEGLPLSSDPDKPYTDKDFLDGGAGNDKLYGGLDDDILLGGSENDIIYGGYEKDPTKLAEGNTDNDILYGEGGSDILFGGLGDDVLYADGRTELNNFKVEGQKVRDYSAKELLEAKTGVAGMVDVLYGGDGNDILYAGEGINFLYGGTGNDVMHAGWHQSDGALTEVFTESALGGLTPSTAYDTFEGKDYFAIGRNDQDIIYNKYGFGEVAWEGGGGILSGGVYDNELGCYIGKNGETYELISDDRLIAFTNEQYNAFISSLDQKDAENLAKGESKVRRDFILTTILAINGDKVQIRYNFNSGTSYDSWVNKSDVHFDIPLGTEISIGQSFIQFGGQTTLLIDGKTKIYDYVQLENGAFVFLNGYIGGGEGVTGYYDDKFNRQPHEKIPEGLDYLPQLGIVLSKDDSGTGANPSGQNSGTPNHNANKTHSPIIIDLDKNGINTSSLGTYFDHDGNGFKENTAWVGSGDGFLVRDINQDGIINNGTELFGNHTVLKNGLNAANGFEALADLDDNGDGVIDAKDAAFNSLKVWVDTNGNGLTDAGELKTLTELGINSIDTAYQESSYVDAHGNEHQQTGKVTFTDGSTSAATDVWFKVNAADRIDSSGIEVLSETKLMANAAGFGLVHDLHQAMTLDPVLKTMLAAVIAETDATKRSGLLDKLIYRWADVDNIAVNSRGTYINAKQLSTLEKLVGSEFVGIVCDVQGKYVESKNPHSNNAPYLVEQYNKFKQFTEAQILAQTHSSLFGGIILSGFGSQVDRPIINWQKLEQALAVLIAENQTNQVKEILSIVEGLGLYSPIATQQRQEFVLALGQKNPSIQSLINDIYFINDINNPTNILINLQTNTQFKQIKAIAFGDGINPDDIYFVRVQDNLVLQTHDKKAIATIENYFFYNWTDHGDNDNGYRINALLFTDGTYWAQTAMQQKILAQMGTDGNDTITGFFDSDDVIVGGKGNDTLYGRTGKDTYVFHKGDGHDTVYTGEGDYVYKGSEAQDIIKFEGIRKEELQFAIDGEDLKIIYGENDSVNILYGLNNKYQINQIITDNGIILVEHKGNALILKGVGVNGNDLLLFNRSDSTIIGGDNNETIAGFGRRNTIYGGAGDDSIIIQDYSGTVYGGEGDDTITIQYRQGSYYGSNHIEGGAGNDIITGSLYYKNIGDYFDGGDGDDIITGNGTLIGGDGNDTLIGDGILNGGNGNDTLSGKGTLNGGDGDDILSGEGTLDGGAGDDIITGKGILLGGAGDDIITMSGINRGATIEGGLGNDIIYAQTHASADTFKFNLGDGQDIIYAYDDSIKYAQYADKILFGDSVAPDMLSYQMRNDDLIIVIGDQGDSITLKDYFLNSYTQTVKSLEFADGTVLSDFLSGATITQYGSTDSETLYGTRDGRDIIYGNAGDDEIYSNNDRQDNYLDGGDGNDNVNGNGTLIGGAGDDLLSGSGLLIGGDGNDRLYGHGTLIGGVGNDYISTDTYNGVSIIKFNLGDGQDTLYCYNNTQSSYQSQSKIMFGEGITADMIRFEVVWNEETELTDVIMFIGNNGDQITLEYYGDDWAQGITQIEFADGTVWTDLRDKIISTQYGSDGDDYLEGSGFSNHIYGGEGNDQIVASKGSSYLNGGAGNDTLEGGYGIFQGGTGNDVIRISGKETLNEFGWTTQVHNSTILFNLGDGQDEIWNSGTDGLNTIQFGAGITSDMISFEYDGEMGLRILVGSQGDQITLKYYLSESTTLPYNLKFADGTVIEDISKLIPSITHQGTDGDDFMQGTSLRDIMYGGAGNDVLSGGAGNNYLDGGAGDDVLDGGYGTFKGGKGNDSIYVSGKAELNSEGWYTRTQDSTFLFDLGDGQDEIWVMSDGGSQGQNTIRFGEGITSDMITLIEGNEADGTEGDLIILIGNQGDKISLKYYLLEEKGLPYRLEFTDGAVVNIGSTPINLAPVVNNIQNDLNINEKSPFSIVLSESLFSDADGDQLTFNITLADGSTLPSWLTYNTITRTLSGTPQNDQVGELNFKITATDPKGLSASQDFKLTVNNVNDAPTAQGSLSEQILKEGEAWQFALPSGSFEDIDKNDALTYSLKMADGSDVPSWLKIDAQTGLISGVPTSSGSLGILIVATDQAGATASHTLDLNIGALVVSNQAPMVINALGDQSLDEKAPFSIVLPENLFSDPDGDQLTFNVTLADGSTLPNWLTYNAVTRALSGTPQNDQVGELNFKITATDPKGLSASQNFKLTVNNVNDAPTAQGSLTEQSLKEGEAWQFTLPSGSFTDVDKNDVLTYSLKMADGSTIPSWLKINAQTGLISGIPTGVSNLSLIIVATDKAGSYATHNFSVKVVNNQDVIYGTSGNDNITGKTGDTIIYGGAGNDTITDHSGNNTIYGGDGADTINGHGTINGGAGIDTINLSGTNNTILFNLGDGTDTVWNAGNTDKVVFGAGITADMVELCTTDYSVYFRIGSEELWLGDYYSNPLQRVEFADGTVWTDIRNMPKTQYGTSGGDNIKGPAGDTIIYGGAGNDTITDHNGNNTIYGGDGADTINGHGTINGGAGGDTINLSGTNNTILFNLGDGGDVVWNAGNTDKVVFGAGITADMVELCTTDYSVYFKIGEDALWLGNYYGNVNNQLQRVEFADGTVWSDIRNMPKTQYGTSGGDNIKGPAGDTIIYGGAGNDTITDHNGNNTIYGGDGADTINGHGTINGGAGNDRINLSGTNNTILFNLGDGLDTVFGFGSTDKIMFGTGITADMVELCTTDYSVYFRISSEELWLGDYYSNPLQRVEFTDGTVWTDIRNMPKHQYGGGSTTINGLAGDSIIHGSDGNDTITDNSGNNIIYGGAGNDTITGKGTIIGGTGNDWINATVVGSDDTFLFNLGDGQDVIINRGGTDKIIFGEGITSNMISYRKDGNNLYIVVGENGDQIALSNYFDTGTYSNGQNIYQTIIRLEFTDGTVWEDIRQKTLTQYYPDNTNTITGTPWNDIIYAGSGNDTITDNVGNNIIYGGAGNDTITGKGTIIGGTGNDWINATVVGSDDKFVFNLGDGQDTIINRGGIDKIIFGEGISSDMISYRQDGNNLYIVVGNNGDQIALSNYFDTAKYSNAQNIYQTIHQMEFADGSTWNFYDQQAKAFVDYAPMPTAANIANQVNSLITAMASFAPEAGSASSLPTHTYDPNSVILASSAA